MHAHGIVTKRVKSRGYQHMMFLYFLKTTINVRLDDRTERFLDQDIKF